MKAKIWSRSKIYADLESWTHSVQGQRPISKQSMVHCKEKACKIHKLMVTLWQIIFYSQQIFTILIWRLKPHFAFNWL